MITIGAAVANSRTTWLADAPGCASPPALPSALTAPLAPGSMPDAGATSRRPHGRGDWLGPEDFLPDAPAGVDWHDADDAFARVLQRLHLMSGALAANGVRPDGLTDRTLTTLVQPSLEKGHAAGRAVVSALEGGSPRRRLLHCELRIGDTTAPPPTTPS